MSPTTSNIENETAKRPRARQSFCDNWWFRRADDPESAWRPTHLPHTFNAEDGCRGGAYYRGKAYYKILLGSLPDNERTFLHFEGCNLSAQVYVAGRLIGQHKGGFTGFFLELNRDQLSTSKESWLEVIADNSIQEDIAPLDGDFVMFGGLYRSVYLLGTRRICFTPTEFGSDGVWITEQHTNRERAIVSWKANITGAESDKSKFAVRLTVKASGGAVVAQTEEAVAFDTVGSALHSGEIAISEPVLWNGLDNPHRYEFNWTLWQGDQLFDEITCQVGIRSLARDENGGILLNGKSIRLRGVCMQQAIAVKGAVFSMEDFERDIRLVREMGANAIRLAHYPHAPALFELCDQVGILVWTEIPLVNSLSTSTAFRSSTKAQLREMIIQLGHHASIFAWGIFNELYSPQSEQSNAFLKELHDVAKELDSSRFTCCSGCFCTPMEARNVTELLGTNAYPGWYEKRPEDMAAWIEEWNASGGERGIGLGEYGAGANPWHHEEPLEAPVIPNGFWHPEEWQAYCHERQYEAIRLSEKVWGSFVWAMFDFFSNLRNEGGTPGINDKGLVTLDRSIRKDAYFFYQANWSSQPIVHIASKRNYFTRVAPPTLKVYSNCEQLRASCNGINLAEPESTFQVVHEFSLKHLVTGLNHIEVTGLRGGQVLIDRREIYLADPSVKIPLIQMNMADA